MPSMGTNNLAYASRPLGEPGASSPPYLMLSAESCSQIRIYSSIGFVSGFGLNSSSLAEAGSTPVVKVDAVAKPPAATLPAMFLPSAAIASRRLLPVKADVGHACMMSDIKRGRASIAKRRVVGGGDWGWMVGAVVM